MHRFVLVAAPSTVARRGNTQYLKTTLTGMTGTALDYVMLVVSGVAGVQRMTREHLAIALALQVRFWSRAMYPPGPTKSLLRQGVIMSCVVVKDMFLCDLLPEYAPRIPRKLPCVLSRTYCRPAFAGSN